MTTNLQFNQLNFREFEYFDVLGRLSPYLFRGPANLQDERIVKYCTYGGYSAVRSLPNSNLLRSTVC